MATHSSNLAWRIPWTEEPGRLHGVAESQAWLGNYHLLTSYLTFSTSLPAIPGITIAPKETTYIWIHPVTISSRDKLHLNYFIWLMIVIYNFIATSVSGIPLEKV